MKCNEKLSCNGTKRIVQKCTADHGREMGISIQYHVMLIRQLNDQILMRCYLINFCLPFLLFQSPTVNSQKTEVKTDTVLDEK